MLLRCRVKAKKLELARWLHWLDSYTQPLFEALVVLGDFFAVILVHIACLVHH